MNRLLNCVIILYSVNFVWGNESISSHFNSSIAISFQSSDTLNPTVILSDSDADNILVNSDTVSITAVFSESIKTTPTLTVSGTTIVNRPMSSTGYYEQLGSTLTGDQYGQFGSAIALNGDGTTLVVGDKQTGNGVVRVYEWDDATQTWGQLGNNINGVATEDLGISVDINDAGDRIIAGSDEWGETGTVRIYEWDGTNWSQMGTDLSGDTSHQSFGQVVSMNSTGDTIIIGEPTIWLNPNSGGVYVYSWDGTNWTAKGNVLRLNSFGSRFGNGIDISNSGNKIAIGASGVNQVFTYDWNGTSWSQTGTTITGSGTFGSEVKFNDDGTVLAIGADAGEVHVFEFNAGDWQQLGTAISGGGPYDPNNHRVSFDLSADGFKLAFGDYLDNGRINIHYWNGTSWETSPSSIVLGNETGYAVALNNSGTKLAVGPRTANNARVYDVNYKFSYDWVLMDEDPLANGTYTLTVSGTDYSGNANAGTTSITFTVSNTLDTTPPTLAQFVDSDLDNVISNGDAITFTAEFSETMAYTPTISISGLVTNVLMTEGADRTTWTYNWQVPNPISNGNYTATVSGTDFVGNAYTGTDSITFTVQNIVDTTSPNIIQVVDDDVDNIIGTDDTIGIEVVFSEALREDPEIEIRGTAVVTQTGMSESNKAFEYTTSFFGDNDGDNYGEMVKISRDGLTVAVGSPDFDANGNSNAGKIEVFRYNISSMTWVQVGSAINGPAVNHRWGSNFDLSRDGNNIIAGWHEDTSRKGIVRVYELLGNTWTQVGSDFQGVSNNQQLGVSVAINAEGNIIVLGETNGLQYIGAFQAFERNGNSWVALGPKTLGTGNSDKIASTLDIDDSGYRIITRNSGSGFGATGQTKVYDYTPTGTSSWTQVGNSIQGTVLADIVGSSVNISGDGNTIAIGSFLQSGPVADQSKFKIKVFDYDQISADWIQKGVTLVGQTNNFGRYPGTATLNKKGDRIIIGANEAPDPQPNPASDDSGRAYVFDYTGGGWVNSVSSLQGSDTTDNFGRSVSLNDEGTIFAVGETGYESSGNTVGRVRIFNNNYWRYNWVVEDNLPLTDGVYTVEFSGEDLSNNAYTGTDSITFTLFTVTGSETLDFPENAMTSVASFTSSIPVTWELSGVDSSSFSIDTNGVVNFTTPPQFAAPTDADTDNIYELIVQARVGSSTSSLPVSVTVVDLTPPTVVLTDTDADNVVSQTDLVTITATFSKNMAATPTISISGLVTNVLMNGANAVWTYLWDVGTTSPTVGNYSATVSGTDTIGNVYSGTDSITFYVSATSSDTTPPTVILSDTDTDNIVVDSDIVTITAVFSEGMAPSPMINIGGLITNASMSMGATNTTWLYTWLVGTGSPTNGTYTVSVTGSDLAANSYNGTDTITFTVSNTVVDTTPPTVNLSSTDGDNTVTLSDIVTITAVFSEPMAASPTLSISGLVNNAIMSGSGTTWTYFWDVGLTNPPNGAYSITVSGTDTAGNSYAGADTLPFTVTTLGPDNIPPTVVLTDSDPDNIVVDSDSVNIVATFSESMRATPTINISPVVSNAEMTGSGNVWTYTWNVGSTNPTNGIDCTVTVNGQDLAGNNYAGIESIVFTVFNIVSIPTPSTGPRQSIIEAGNNGVAIRYMDQLSRPVTAFVPKGKALVFCHQQNSIVLVSGSYTLVTSSSCD